MPGNALLPAHEGQVITRGLQEWACLLPQDLPFAPAARLLGWQVGQEQVISDTTIRTLVQTHGQIIRQAEQEQVQTLLHRRQDPSLKPLLPVPPHASRVRPGWPAGLSCAVETALQSGASSPPAGVCPADWERVLEARQQEGSGDVGSLRRLGPHLQPNLVLVTMDEILTRATKGRRFWQLRTARIVTSFGSRYVSGLDTNFLQLVLALLTLCCGRGERLLLIADAARWIRQFFLRLWCRLPRSKMLLDWYHLKHKCSELCSLLGGDRASKRALLHSVLRCLWQGEVSDALALLESSRAQVKNETRLQEWIDYLKARTFYIPNYRARRKAREYIGSGHVEKANDLLVARRQKGQGMHWSLATSDALAALRTLMLNGGWDRYWIKREVLPLCQS
jgi:hypothetical protein